MKEILGIAIVIAGIYLAKAQYTQKNNESSGTIVLNDTKAPVILDINEHSIDDTSSVQIGEDADLQIFRSM